MRKTGSLAKARSAALTLLGVLAIAFQCFVVQTHIHAPIGGFEPAFSASVVDVKALATAETPNKGAPATCLICQQMALFGATLLPSAHAPVLIERSFIENAAIVSVAVARTFSSHNWRSRAPPLSL